MEHRVRLFALVVLACVFGAQPGPLLAETYEYDAAGRLSRITAPDGTVTRYRYDALGNLLSVSQAAASFPPVVTAVTPTQVRAGTSEDIVAQGQNLADATVIAPDQAFTLSNLVTSADSLSFSLDTAEDAPLGDQVFRVRNQDGEAAFTLDVLPPLPRIGVRPLPLALPEDGSLRQIIVTLSHADAVDRTIELAIADSTVVELQTASVDIPAGETEGLAGLRGLTGGLTNLTLTSPGLEPAVYSVYVTAEFGSINSKYSALLGVQVGDSDGGPGGPGELDLSARSDDLGLVVGPLIDGIEPWAVSVGDASVPLTIRGSGLQAVDQVTLDPPDDLVLSGLDVLADGSAVTLDISVDAMAELGPRRLVLGGADEPYPPAAPGADLLDIVVPLPVLDSLDPNHALRGTAAATLTIRGHNLERALSVEFVPPDGMDVGTDLQADADGEFLTLSFSVASDAPLGERLVRVTTPAGVSSAAAGPNNSFQVVEDVAAVFDSVTAALLGVQLGSLPPGPPGDGHTFARPLGLAVGSLVSALSPPSGEIGTGLDLELQGVGLEGATELRLEPADGLSVGSLLIDPLGEFVRADLGIAADAPETVRRVRMFAAGVEIPFADPAAAAFLVTAPAPVLQAVNPNSLQIGAGAETLTLYGRNLDRADRVDALPAQGLVMGTPAVDPDGTSLTLDIEALADAAAGERVLTVTTPAGTTDAAPSPKNSLTLYQDALITPMPLVAPLVGLELGDGQGGAELSIDGLTASLLGVEVAAPPDPPPSLPAVEAAPILGVVSGSFATRIEAPHLVLGDTYTLRVHGQSLGAVDGAGVFPGLDLAIGTPVPAADGTSVVMSLTVPADAAVEPRALRLVAGPDQVLFADPAAAVLELAAGVPRIDSIQPIVAQPGDTVELVVRGSNLQRAVRALAEPTDGLVFDTEYGVDPSGTELRVRLYISEDAALGARTIRVETPGGTSTAVASPANTFTVY